MDYRQVLMGLLSIDTSVPPGNNYQKAIDFLDPLFRQAGCVTEKVPIPAEQAGGCQGRFNLVVHRRNPGKPRIIFYTHVDVVPAKGWKAFEPRIEDGKVYGRGAVDMKGEIVSLLMALERIKDRTIGYDVSAMVTVDEETGHGGGDELRYIRSYLEPVEGSIFFSLDADAGYVQAATLGILAGDITVRGRSVHQARSHLGENAVEKAIKLCRPLLALGERIGERTSQIPVAPGLGIPYLKPNLTIAMINGGIKVNTVPDECVISFARRIIPEEDPNLVEGEIMQALSSVPDIRWDYKRTLFFRPIPPAIDEPEAERLSAIIQKVMGRSGKYGFLGSLPLDPVGFEWKARIFGTGLAGAEQNPHGVDEFAYLKDVEDLSEIVVRYLTTP